MDDGFIYVAGSEGEASVLDWRKGEGITELAVPVSLGGLPVTCLEETAFFFGNDSLKRILLPGTLSEMDPGAFYGLDELERIEADGCKRFFDRDGVPFERRDGEVVLFKYPTGRRGESYTVASADAIGDQAFAGCRHLKELVLAEGVRKIAPHALEGCAVRRLVLPSTLEEQDVIDLNCSYMPKLERIEVDPGCKRFFDRGGVLYGDDGRTLLFVPEGRREAGFAIAEGCEEVHQGAFGGQGFRTLAIPKSLKDAVGLSCNLPELEAYRAEEGGELKSLDGVLYTADFKALVSFPRGKQDKRFIVPPMVEEISAFAFYGSMLKEIVLPGTVKSIGSNAFAGCGSDCRVSFSARGLSEAYHWGLRIGEPDRPVIRPVNGTGFLDATRAFYDKALAAGCAENEACLALDAVFSSFLNRDDTHNARVALLEAYVVSGDISAMSSLVTWICEDELKEEYGLLEDAADAVLQRGEVEDAAKIGGQLLRYGQDELAKLLLNRVLER